MAIVAPSLHVAYYRFLSVLAVHQQCCSCVRLGQDAHDRPVCAPHTAASILRHAAAVLAAGDAFESKHVGSAKDNPSIAYWTMASAVLRIAATLCQFCFFVYCSLWFKSVTQTPFGGYRQCCRIVETDTAGCVNATHRHHQSSVRL